jgi:hypothetical protein
MRSLYCAFFVFIPSPAGNRTRWVLIPALHPVSQAAQPMLCVFCIHPGSVDDFCFSGTLSLRFSAAVHKLPKDGN